MDQDDLAPRIARKRSRSPSIITTSSHQPPAMERSDDQYSARAAKRARTIKKDVPAYDAPVDEHARQTMAKFNPLGRKALTRARRAANRAMRTEAGGSAGGGNGGMEIDDGRGGLGGGFDFELGSTFIV
jgi:nuclear GTP-binding protein